MSDDRLDALLEIYFEARALKMRSAHSRRIYRLALFNLRLVLGHHPTLADLTDESVTKLMAWLLEQGKSVATVNERRARINALWTWLARKGRVSTWPTVAPLAEPQRIPQAWTREQLTTLLVACQNEQGEICGIPAPLWWRSLHLVMWSTGERIGALMAARWRNLVGAWLYLPAEIRKGQRRDACYRLSPQALESLERIRLPQRDLVWPWHRCHTHLWCYYKRLRKRAGLPTDRNSSFHRMRRSVASHLAALGGNATEAMGHSSPAVTRDSYIDPTIAVPPQPSDLLFRLEEE